MQGEWMSRLVNVCVCRVAAMGLDGRGVLTSRWGTGTRTPRGRKRHRKAQSETETVPRFRTGCLAFDGRDPSLLPTPRRVLMRKKYFSVGLFVKMCDSIGVGSENTRYSCMLCLLKTAGGVKRWAVVCPGPNSGESG
jgi:hypothetical protein